MKLTSDKSLFGNTATESSNNSETETYSQPNRIQEVPTQKKNQSVIGGNIKFRGELIGTEDIHIEGCVEGTIIMEGHNLTIGSQGSINANVHANNITINGSLTGDVLADELISIKDSAQVKGNLIAPRIQLDDGGKFRGSMDMIDNEQEKKDSIVNFKEKLIHPHLPEKQNSVKKDSSVSAYNSAKKLNGGSETVSKNEKKNEK
ncbi:MAG: polymer-forming cytoskeletal protein [Kangiellaceae bacterium]|nr:polymer-forming cytoskeletal protein [Kangiellaceae bacterium]